MDMEIKIKISLDGYEDTMKKLQDIDNILEKIKKTDCSEQSVDSLTEELQEYKRKIIMKDFFIVFIFCIHIRFPFNKFIVSSS